MNTTKRFASPVATAATLAGIALATAVTAQAAPALIEAVGNPASASTEIVSGYLSPENFQADLKQKYHDQKAADTLAIQAAVAEKMKAEAATAAAAHTTTATSTSTSTSSAAAGGASGDVAAWASSPKSMAVKNCESGGNYSTNTGNGYYGAWQFDIPSWLANGGGAYAPTPDQAPAWAQDQVAYNYYQIAGWGPWGCG